MTLSTRGELRLLETHRSTRLSMSNCDLIINFCFCFQLNLSISMSVNAPCSTGIYLQISLSILLI
jgi:hypothetical protein